MNLDDPHTFELFLEVYGTLPRAGPGGDEHTLHALGAVPRGPAQTVLDLGCGPGAQTVALARALPDAQILALDILPSMVETTRRRILEAGLDHRARAEVGDMASPPVPAGSQDLIWCEGAVYFLGVEAALRAWRPLLTPGGAVAFTEPVWLRPAPPAELRQWWEAEYPAITDDRGVRAAVDAAAFSTVASFPLPADAWWEQYYRPMEGRIADFATQHAGDPAASDVVAAAEHEIQMHRRFSDWYSYGFFVVQPRPDPVPGGGSAEHLGV